MPQFFVKNGNSPRQEEAKDNRRNQYQTEFGDEIRQDAARLQIHPQNPANWQIQASDHQW